LARTVLQSSIHVAFRLDRHRHEGADAVPGRVLAPSQRSLPSRHDGIAWTLAAGVGEQGRARLRHRDRLFQAAEPSVRRR
jgi:hypothetical protein